MLIELFFDSGLGHASYLVADPDAGVAFLVDPDCDIEPYLAAASRLEVLITHSFETHVHNDYLSGSHALATLRPITVVAGATAELAYPHLALADGGSLTVGELLVRCVATPGHTPEHVSYLVSDLRRTEEPQWLFSGGALLVDNIARVDLLGRALEEQLARAAYATLRERLLTLPDHLAVFPTHGGGSACSGAVAGSRWTTLGFERRHNATVQLAEGEFPPFHDHIRRGLPAAPHYYAQVRAQNGAGASLASRPPLAFLTEMQVMAGGAALIDPRPPALFGAGHRAGALNVVANDAFASRLAATVVFGTPLVLLAGSSEQAQRLRDHLLVVGYDEVRGYAPPVSEAMVSLIQIDPRRETPASGDLLLDVRDPAEWQQGHVPGARHIPYARLTDELSGLPKDRPIICYCASGIRSSLAASVLQAAGFDARNLRGGFAAWQAAGLPVVVD